MEEWIGERWHRLIDRAADRSFAAQAVALADVERSVGLLFRAAGGAPALRVVPAAQARTGGPRTWLQRLAGSGQRAAFSMLDRETLALPPQLAVFDDAGLNRDLYLWLAVLAAVAEPSADWVAGNCAATARALQRCPGMADRFQRLRVAQAVQRPVLATLAPAAARAEAAVQAALAIDPVASAGAAAWAHAGVVPLDVAPVWLWLQVSPTCRGLNAADGAIQPEPTRPKTEPGPTARSPVRRRTRAAEEASGRAPMLLPSRTESLMTWSEHVPLDPRANNLTGVLVGDFKSAEVRPLIDRYFGRVPRGRADPPEVVTFDPKQIGEKRYNAEAETSPTVRIWYHSVPFIHKDRTVADLLTDILSGRTGRLYKGLVLGKELANEAQASVSLKKYAGIIEVESVVKDGKDPAAVEAGVYEELERLAREPVPDAELQKVKNQAKANAFRRLSSPFFIALQLMVYDGLGDWKYINTFSDEVDRVTAADIQRVARASFTRENRTVGVFLRKAGAPAEALEGGQK